MDKWHRERCTQQLSTGLGAHGLIFFFFFPFLFFFFCCSPPFPSYPCSALVGFIHAVLAVRTFASRGFANCRAHNNFFACTIYIDKEFFLLKHPLTPGEQEQRQGQPEIHPSIHPPKKTKQMRFKQQPILTKQQPCRSSKNNRRSCFCCFFFISFDSLEVLASRSSLRAPACRTGGKQNLPTRSSLHLHVIFADTCRHSRDVCGTPRPPPQRAQSCKPQRRHHTFGSENLTTPSTRVGSAGNWTVMDNRGV